MDSVPVTQKSVHNAHISNLRFRSLAGCTDEDFTSPRCPGKGTSEQQLLNLVQCADSETESSVVWSACSAPATRTEIGPPAACTCTDSDNGILTGPKSFAQVASLPTAKGETISFQPGHTPKTKGAATVTSTASDGQPTTMTRTYATSAPTASSTAAATGDSGLSKGAKAGIGVGVAALAAGVLALLAFVFVRCYRRRRSEKPKGKGKTAYEPAAPDPDMAQSPPPQYGSPGSPYYPPPSPHDVPALGYPGYTGFFKSELPAAPVESKPVSGFASELPADNCVYYSRQGLDRNATPSMLSMPGSVGRHSMVSDISRAPSVAPSMQSNQGEYLRSPTTGNMAPIAELHG